MCKVDNTFNVPCWCQGRGVLLAYLCIGWSEKARVAGNIYCDQNGITDQVADFQCRLWVLCARGRHACRLRAVCQGSHLCMQIASGSSHAPRAHVLDEG